MTSNTCHDCQDAQREIQRLQRQIEDLQAHALDDLRAALAAKDAENEQMSGPQRLMGEDYAELRRLREAVALHRPMHGPIEFETVHLKREPNCDRWIEPKWGVTTGGCVGHTREAIACEACRREWPCPTVRAAGLDGEAPA